MSTQTLFDSKSTLVPSRCIDCGIILGNYSLWHKGEGPLCHLCHVKRENEK